MKKLTLSLVAICLLGATTLFAEDRATETITYEGQASEVLRLVEATEETRYREEEQDTTCTRQIPYTENVCANETRYRTQCHTEPGRQHCYTTYERICRTVHRTRQECTNKPGRRVCRQQPGRRQCRTLPSGEQRCRNIPGREICTNKPGRRVCRQVPYTDRVCDRVPRQQCDWIPPRNVCNQVPYQEYVCRDVTRYRTEEYACTRTVQIPYQVPVELVADVDLSFKDSNSFPSKASLTLALNKEGKVGLKVTDLSEVPALILAKKRSATNRDGDVISVKEQYKLNFLDKKVALAPVAQPIDAVKLSHKQLSFLIGPVHSTTSLKLKVKVVRQKTMFHSREVKLDKVLEAGDYTLTPTEGGTIVTLNFKQHGTELDKKKKHDVSLEVGIEFNARILNQTRPQMVQTKEITIKTAK
ncbi:MAG: hypothetical protein HN509_06965 [Halobacteriovoraceae bacterium]|jgi:hypothetical protein|nr:hypothetical protein [Halobacteriovoraceae bacterium]